MLKKIAPDQHWSAWLSEIHWKQVQNARKREQIPKNFVPFISASSLSIHWKTSPTFKNPSEREKNSFSHISVQVYYRFIEKRVNYWLRGKNYWLPLIDLGKKWRCPRNRGAAVIDVKQFPDKERICLFVMNIFSVFQDNLILYIILIPCKRVFM